MATGRLGVQDLTADTDTTVYTVPVGTYAVANVSVTNRNQTSITLRLAMATTSTPIRLLGRGATAAAVGAAARVAWAGELTSLGKQAVESQELEGLHPPERTHALPSMAESR